LDEKDKLIILLQKKVAHLESQIAYLQVKLHTQIVINKVEADFKSETYTKKQCSSDSKVIDAMQKVQQPQIVPDTVIENIQTGSIKQETITPDHAKFFYSLFKGRNDIFSRRAKLKNGKAAYFPVCENFWRYGICPKRDSKKVKCYECSNHRWRQLTQRVLMEHLIGRRDDCTDVIGIYPMFQDETCCFLVFDFDNHDKGTIGQDNANNDSAWIEEVNAMRDICKINNVDILVERSRSGKGAHVWLFFVEHVKTVIARQFGAALLTKGAESVNQKDFKSYDRMIPAQDYMPEGGFGNLVALPLQGRALRLGNSAFVDERWNALPDQWAAMRSVRKISLEFIEKKITEWSVNGILGTLAEDMSGETGKEEQTEKPWIRKSETFNRADVEGILHIVYADMIYVNVDNVEPRLQNKLRRLAAFSNPLFYKNQAMGLSNYDVPRITSCSRDRGHYLCLPRGCEEKLKEKLLAADITFNEKDERQQGKHIKVSFIGNLYGEQMKAVEKLIPYNTGVLAATTAFGKTAVGAYIVANLGVNAMILVHNTEIMQNWEDELNKFLKINEPLPEYRTPKGRLKKRKSVIGKLYSGHNSLNGIVDIVMVSSLGKKENIRQVVKDYGLVIMDECHHAGAATVEHVLNEVNANHVYGFTATPKREDGQEQKIFMQFGKIRYRYTALDRARAQGIEHYILPRFTHFVVAECEKIKIQDAYKAIVNSDIRNKQIIADTKECIENGRTPLVLTKYKEHANVLFDKMKKMADHVFLLQGGGKSKEKETIREQMKNVHENETVILVAIGKYIGEGFNYPRLDTLLLAMPISWQGNVEQYAGRLHRDYATKKDVIIYDYVDAHVRVLEKMYHKRVQTYKKIGYKIISKVQTEIEEDCFIYGSDNYWQNYERDITNARQEIIISSPGLGTVAVNKTIRLLEKVQENGVAIKVITLPPEQYSVMQINRVQNLITLLRKANIDVKEKLLVHEHYAIIDQKIVWYGNMNLLSKNKPDDNLMRLNNEEVAQELMLLTFGKENN